jgi:hypothetical protein
VRHLEYAMRFVGSATPTGEVGGVLHTATTAPSAALHAVVGDDGLRVTRVVLPGGVARCVTVVVFTGNETFLESGEVRFGDAHRLRFSTMGSGYLGPSANLAFREGAVIWRIEAGEGQFTGASGMIGATILLHEDGRLVVHHLGLVVLPESDPS